MKLFECYATGVNYDPSDLIVAESEEKAIEEFKKRLDDFGDWYGGISVHEISHVDGYKVVLVKE